MGEKNRSSGTTKLPYWNKQSKKHPSAKQLCHFLGIGWDSVQFIFVWCLKHRGNCTQRGWGGLGTWFAILVLVAGLDTVSMFSKRDQRMALCALLWCFPHTWHCPVPGRNISIYFVSIIAVWSLRVWASGKQKATRKGCSAVRTSLSFWQVEVFSLVDQGIWQPCCQGINNLDYFQLCGFLKLLLNVGLFSFFLKSAGGEILSLLHDAYLIKSQLYHLWVS